ncbi:MAG: branched-chain amino acid ABC transporter permease [Nocardioidaceae bacterium]
MTVTVQLVIDGLALGALLAVVASGLSLVFGVMGVVNFLHAEFITIGGYVTYFVVTQTGVTPLVGVAVSTLTGIGLGFVVQTVFLARIVSRPPLDGLLLTYGLSVVGLGLITYFFTGDYRSYSTGVSGGLDAGPVYLAWRDVVAAALCALLLAGLALLLHRTRIGGAMRAVAQHRDAAAACGIDLRKVDAVSFAVGGGLGGAAGAILSAQFVTTPELGHQWLLIGFVVVVLGGVGSLAGAMLGGLSIGVVQVVCGYVLDDSWARLLVYLMLFALLLLRPSGLTSRAKEAL